MQPSLEQWLIWDTNDQVLTKHVNEATRLVWSVHRCPLPEQFHYRLEFKEPSTEFPEGVRWFPLEGCEVRWNNALPDEFGVWATFVPPEPPNPSRAVISLSRSDMHPMLRFVHEVGHLVHTTMLGVLAEDAIQVFRDVCLADPSYGDLRRLARRKMHDLEVARKATPGDPRLELLNQLALAAMVDASADEWFARTYSWLILRKHRRYAPVLEKELTRMGIDEETPLYPPKAQVDRLATQMGTLLKGF